MKKFTFFLIAASLFSAVGAFAPQKEDVSGFFQKNLSSLNSTYKQEKIYLHTDRARYGLGDTVWFRAYLVDALSNAPNTLSRYVYVELIDDIDSVLVRKMIRPDSLGVFYGEIALPEGLEKGRHYLRSYTRNMTRQGEAFPYESPLEIDFVNFNNIFSKIKYNDDGSADIAFVDYKLDPYAKARVKVTIHDPLRKDLEQTHRTDRKGVIHLARVTRNDFDRIDVEINNDSVWYFSRFLIPEQINGLDVQFFPEGGDLIAGVQQRVYFKAVGSDGFHVDVSGAVYDASGSKAADIASEYKGMGSFVITPRQGETYTARIINSTGQETSVILPASMGTACVVSASIDGGRIHYDILGGNASGLHLAAVSGNSLVTAVPVTSNTGTLDASDAPAGILALVLTDGASQVYSQRLLFVQPAKQQAQITPDNRNYAAREKIALDIELRDNAGQPLVGVYSLAVTDNSLVERHFPATGNIVSNLLLSSHIRGHVEDPDDFLKDGDMTSARKVDLLLSTQGWTKYFNPHLLMGRYNIPAYSPQRTMVATGMVRTLSKGPAKNATVILSSNCGDLSNNDVDLVTQTDDEGRFAFPFLETQEDVTFLSMARTKGNLEAEVLFDRQEAWRSPLSIAKPLNRDKFPVIDRIESIESGGDTILTYYYKNGEKVYVMPMLNFRAPMFNRSWRPSAQIEPSRGRVGFIVRESDLKNNNAYSLMDYLYRSYNYMFSSGTYPLKLKMAFVFNDMVYPDDIGSEWANDIPLSYIDRIDVYRPGRNGHPAPDEASAVALYGKEALNGAIVVWLKGPLGDYPKFHDYIRIVGLMGYTDPTQFYVPKYEIDKNLRNGEPDPRTSTVYWSPAVETDGEGKARVEFYSADRPATYTVTLEGVSDSGVPVVKQQSVTRNK